MKKELKVKQMGNLLIINDELYEPVFKEHQRDVELIRFRRISKKRFEFLKRKITDRLASRVKPRDIIDSALCDMNMRGLERIYLELNKKKPKVRKEHGCFDLVVGKGTSSATIPIR